MPRTLACAAMLVAAATTPAFSSELFDAIKRIDLHGETLAISGPWTSVDEANFRAALAPFVEATGVTLKYAGSQSFEQQIRIDVEAGSPPNIAIFPQPGLAAEFARKGALAPLGQDSAKWVLDNYAAGQSWVDLGTYSGSDGAKAFYGFVYKADLKSLVWYVPDNFAEAGYKVPETMEELIALSERMVADGHTPWCIGLGSGSATGWPATDWVEDLMLRTQSPDVYDQWVKNEIS